MLYYVYKSNWCYMCIIAVDFDGTLCKKKYPEIGGANTVLINWLIARKREGFRLILNTCRSGKLLAEAVLWCKQYGLEFEAINENLPDMIERFGGDCRKICADIYIDDLACRPEEITTKIERGVE